ncbi:MAG: phosphatidylcholine synthase [Proteobacteria bacterium SG_bin9]|nr:MAG: phosphatidylcholine synthase [Proteobacteria bacterium SG_bin9]
MTSTQPTESGASSSARAAAFGVHLFTALGSGIALIAMLEAVREHWLAMFGWLGVALIVDAIDGPLARRFDVARLQPNWSGDTLDLVVDFLTYVFIPAYAIVASNLLLPVSGAALGVGIVVSGALYFADRRMKTVDNHFRGFPTLWNAVAFHLFVLKPQPLVASAIVAAFIVLTFVPINVMHPVRTTRFRIFNLALIALWAVLAVVALVQDFNVPAPISFTMCAIALYVLLSDTVIRLITRART